MNINQLNNLNKKKMIKKETRGGKRKGSGQPKKDPTKTLSFRVPLVHHEELKETIHDVINDYYINKRVIIPE